MSHNLAVLILVVMEDALALDLYEFGVMADVSVLILVVMEDALAPFTPE